MIIEKLTQPAAHLNCDDLTPNQKKLLWEIMKKYGASQGFAYDRFFKEGFLKWELLGINDIKRQFLNEHLAELFPDIAPVPASAPAVSASGIEAPVPAVSPAGPTITSIINTDGEFYRTLGRVFGLKTAFTDHMGNLGMGSNQVLNKFSSDDWKDYERVGVLAVVLEFEQKVSEMGE